MSLVIVGTTPVMLLDENPRRKKLDIQMQPQTVDANNTGRVHLGSGFQPVATVGHSQQGLILIQASAFLEPSTNQPLDPKWRGKVWATASAASQSLVVEEENETPEPVAAP